MKNEGARNQEQEIKRFKGELEDIPDPSCGRIQELREKIKNKTFFAKESILETAERIAAKFFGKD